ncbi:hypothetical protein DFH09DRAFT_1108699 [Mycena vulgaris]|nr:hypothetical protein DFH09DRAFT_1108699 [Mycena vulgaris]
MTVVPVYGTFPTSTGSFHFYCHAVRRLGAALPSLQLLNRAIMLFRTHLNLRVGGTVVNSTNIWRWIMEPSPGGNEGSVPDRAELRNWIASELIGRQPALRILLGRELAQGPPRLMSLEYPQTSLPERIDGLPGSALVSVLVPAYERKGRGELELVVQIQRRSGWRDIFGNNIPEQLMVDGNVWISQVNSGTEQEKTIECMHTCFIGRAYFVHWGQGGWRIKEESAVDLVGWPASLQWVATDYLIGRCVGRVNGKKQARVCHIAHIYWADFTSTGLDFYFYCGTSASTGELLLLQLLCLLRNTRTETI